MSVNLGRLDATLKTEGDKHMENISKKPRGAEATDVYFTLDKRLDAMLRKTTRSTFDEANFRSYRKLQALMIKNLEATCNLLGKATRTDKAMWPEIDKKFKSLDAEWKKINKQVQAAWLHFGKTGNG